MKKIDENMEWKKEAPYLASLPRSTPYQVPANYFENLTESINTATLLANFNHNDNQGFYIPSNYFEELTTQIQAQISLHQTGSETDGFYTPTNYFENLQSKIITIATQKPTKTTRLWSSDIIKYASVACVVIISALVLFLNQQNKTYTNDNAELANEQLLYGIDENVIIEHLQENSANSNSTDQDLENYILNNFSSRDISNNL